MTIPTLAGITPQTITSDRIKTRVLFSGPAGGKPVLFLHGNSSSATWWEETMLALPAGYRGFAPDQRGFGDAELDKKIDATRGAGDWADDALALLDVLGIEQA
ncbi:MAG: alpha/beta hydrolase, partial [Anaerolineae bacterium]|nr:alpha/beta hydrolase [Anaerolineae bacterium]